MAVRGKRASDSMRKRAEQLEQRVRAALDEATSIALGVAKANAPGKVPATLKAYATRGAVAGVRIYSTWALAKFVENNTAPHIIEPYQAKALRFVQNGSVAFARRVHHPGTKGHHFFRAGREAGREALKRLLAQAIAGA